MVLLVGLAAMLGLAACTTRSSSSGSTFAVSGQLGSFSSSGIHSLVTINGKTITDVIAVNTQTHEQRLGTISGTSFSVDITPDVPWIIIFADRNQTGPDMIVAHFQSSVLEALRPSDPGSANLGTVSFTDVLSSGNIAASPSISFAELLEAIGMSSGDASFFGELDGVALRYTNPDVNNNGALDVVEDLYELRLDFHNRYTPRVAGVVATMSNVGNAFLPDNTDFRYDSTGVIFEVAKTAFSAPSSFQYQFSASATLVGGATVPANTYQTQSFSDNPLYERYQFDVETIQPPSGQYDFRIGSNTYTFSDITVPNLSLREGFILPFVRFNVRDDNTVSGISWKWMKKTSGGWTQASAAEIALVVVQTGTVSVYIDGDNLTSNKNIQWSLAQDPTGTVSMGSAQLSNLTASESAAVVYSRFGHLGISYDDAFGMRYFAF